MRALADQLRDTTPENSLILVELLAAQIVAWAAYKGRKFSTLDEINAAVIEVAGYPMHNSMRLPPEQWAHEPSVGSETAIRVAAIVGLKID